MANPIRRLLIDALPPLIQGQGTFICWRLHKDWCTKSLEYAVLVGVSPSGPFKKVGLTQDTEFVDSVERRHGVSQDVYYTIITQDRDTGEQYRGPVQRVGSAWNHREWRMARELVRREMLRMVKGEMGVRGHVLHRRDSGERCSCIAPDTGSVKNPACTLCYGTGYVGGYYPPIECWVDQNPERIIRRLDPEQGALSQVITEWRTLAYPPLEPNDIWVDATSDKRWRVMGDIRSIAHIRGIPIIQQVSVQILERERPEYEFPIDDS